MDKERARFILQSFRPDGADAQDPDFAEALTAAAADRELGGWLARERAQDAAFAAALADVEIPEDLRDTILNVLNGEMVEGDFTSMDAEFVGALASVRPPDGLRDQILAAMEVERTGGSVADAPRRTMAWLRTASIAAAVALGAFLAFQVTGGPSSNNGSLAALTPAGVEREAINVLNASFSLDRKTADHSKAFAFLAEKDLPIPKDLPAGLKGVPTLGCKVLKLDGHKASLVCFQVKGNVLHLVVMDLDDVTGEFGELADAKGGCRQCPVTGWSRSSWTDDERAFMLLGKVKPDEMAQAF